MVADIVGEGVDVDIMSRGFGDSIRAQLSFCLKYDDTPEGGRGRAPSKGDGSKLVANNENG